MLRSLLLRRSFTSSVTPAPPRYFISRTANNNLPVYTDFKNGRTQLLTIIRRVQGDAYALKNDILSLFPDAPKDYVKVNPVNNHVVIKGLHMDDIKQWLAQKGF